MEVKQQLESIIQDYNSLVMSVDRDARDDNDRAYGGVIRAAKGKLQERITECLIRITWQFIGGNPDLLEINSKKIPIPIRHEYIDRIKSPEVKEHIRNNMADYIYKLSVDKHIFINGKFVIGIECKAYTENAMIKRILIDFDLLKTQYHHLSCYLFQLESQLGGDYHAIEKPVYGSHSTHTIQSYFLSDLKIITLLEGERKVNQPIHQCFKPLKIEVLEDVVLVLAKDMERFL